MSDINFTVVSQYGSALLDTDGGSSPYGLTNETIGFGVPPVQHRFLEGAGTGGKRRNTRVGMRPLDLGMIFVGTSRLDLDNKVRAFAKLIRPVDPSPKLIAAYADGTTYELPFVYQSGLEISYADVEIGYKTATYKTVLSLTCEDPFWVSQTETSRTLQQAGAGRGLLPKLSQLQLTDSSVIGNVTITNPGEVESPPIYDFVGPMNPFTVTSVIGSFAYSEAIAAGVTVRIDMGEGTVKNSLGVNKYNKFSGVMAPFPPGDTAMVVNAPGTNGDSRVIIRFKNRREVIL